MPRSRRIAARFSRSSSTMAAASSKTPATASCWNSPAWSARSRLRSRCNADGGTQRPASGGPGHALPDGRPHGRRDRRRGRGVRRRRQHRRPPRSPSPPRAAWRSRKRPISKPASIWACSRPRRQPAPEKYRGAHHRLDLAARRARWPGERGPVNLPPQHRPRSWACCPLPTLPTAQDEYFADGLTEDLIHALSLQSFYRVLSRTRPSRSRART